MTDDDVELFSGGGSGACGELLQKIRDPGTGKWLGIAPQPGMPLAFTGKGVVVAVVDTGLAAEHPTIAARLVEQVDFSGDGTGDRCGHGTVVALILLTTAPDATLVDVKAVDDRGRSSAKRLIRAFEWIGQRGGIHTVNVSAGAYRLWCNADCDLCKAALDLTERGIVVTAAAGNRPGVIACPAKAVIRVGEFDVETEQLTPTSSPAGPGGVVAPRLTYLLVAADN